MFVSDQQILHSSIERRNYKMNRLTKTLATMVAAAVFSASAFAQSASEVPHASALVPSKSEAAPKLVLGEPFPEALARGALVVPYRVENLRILPILGPGAGEISPRVGHLHVGIDDLPWHWADFGENAQTIVVVGLAAGQHKLAVGLAGSDHHVYGTETVTFTIPDTVSKSH
jgi:hypothetical protein